MRSVFKKPFAGRKHGGEKFRTLGISANAEKLKALDDALGMLNELTAEQMKTFEAAVKRRPLLRGM